jgi:hypothetical protein
MATLVVVGAAFLLRETFKRRYVGKTPLLIQ